MDSTELEEHKSRNRIYQTIVQSSTFISHLKTFNMYFSDSKLNQQLQIVQEDGVLVLFGMLKIYWGTQKVIRLKKEELSWKRKSVRLAYGNGLDEKLMSAMGSGAKYRHSPTRLQEGIFDISDKKTGAGDPHKQESLNNAPTTSMKQRKSDAYVEYQNENAMKRRELKNALDEADSMEDDGDKAEEDSSSTLMQSSTMPRTANLKRRTMSFSGHLYNSKTAVFRPKYGTISNVRASSRHTTSEVIRLLLNKFAVENRPEEFDLYWVLQNGETHAFQLNDFPLLKRVQLGPAENVAKIFIKEKKSDEVSPEVAQYVNLQFSELHAILRKFEEEEQKEILKINQRYVQYKANLQRKLSVVSAEIASKESKSKTKVKAKERKKGKEKVKGKKK